MRLERILALLGSDRISDTQVNQRCASYFGSFLLNMRIIGFSQNRCRLASPQFDLVDAVNLAADCGLAPAEQREPLIWTSYWLQLDQVVRGSNWIDKHPTSRC